MKPEITLHHPSSSHGIPVILDDDGEIMEYHDGIAAIMVYLDLSREALAEVLGYKSARSIEKFFGRSVPPAAVLNNLSVLLEGGSK